MNDSSEELWDVFRPDSFNNAVERESANTSMYMRLVPNHVTHGLISGYWHSKTCQISDDLVELEMNILEGRAQRKASTISRLSRIVQSHDRESPNLKI